MPARSAREPNPAASVTPTAFAPQKSGASEKDLVLFEIERARVAVKAAIQGLGGASASRPIAPGKWSPHEIVLHLAVRDRVRIEELDSIAGGNAASWAGLDTAGQAAANEAHLAALRATSWEDAVRLLDRTRSELLAGLQAVPAEPADRWGGNHPFGRVIRSLAPHDRSHAQQIKNARVAG
jgi:hypothetical protein